MIKIIYIIDDLQIGGAQTHLLKLTNALNSKKFLVEVVCLGRINEMITTRYPRLKINVVTMHSIRKINFWKGFINLAALLKERRPDIVHTYLSTANVFGAIAAKVAKVPIIITSRRDMGHFRTKRIAFLERWVNNFTDKIICVSEAVKKNTLIPEHIDPDNITVIHNGIDADLYVNERHKAQERDIFTVGIVAGMNREIKGQGYFIEAAKEVLKEVSNVKFLLIGDGPLRKSYELRATNSELKEKIIFLGERNDIPELLSVMDVSVNASYSEGMSNTILESMAAGVPVVATAADGNLETVEDGQTGFLIPAKDPKAMAQAIIKILNDKGLAKKMGENALRLVSEKFTLERMVQNYSNLYSELINAPNPRSSASFDQRKSATDTSAVISVKNNPRPSSSKKIGYVVSLFPCWSETFILNEMIEMGKRGFGITIFSIRKDLEEFTQDKAKQFLKSTKYVYVPKAIIAALYWLFKRPLVFISLIFVILNQRYSSIRVLLKNTYAFFSGCYFAIIAKKEHLTHIHAHFATYPALTALVMSKLTNIPFTFTAHAHDIFLDKTLLKEKAKAAKAIITISDYNKRYIVDYCQNGVYSKIKVIHCGLDLKDFSGVNGEHKVNTVISVGRLTRMKGFEYLIRACSRLKNQMPVKCCIIGDGPLRDELERLIIELGVRDCVRIEGITGNNEIKQLLQDSTAFVLSSIWDKNDGQDGIPVVLMEAMALGVPVVSSNISGIPELVEDGKTGLLAEPGNVEQLSQKILQLLSDKELQSQLAAAGRRKIEEEFDVVKSVDKLIEVFTDAR